MAEEMYLNLRMEHGNDIRDAVYDAVRLGFNDDNEAEFEELCSLLVKLNKVVRKQCYRGQTQKEVFSDSGLMKLI